MANPSKFTGPGGTRSYPPIIIPLSIINGMERAAFIAITMGRGTEARVIFIRPPFSSKKERALKRLEEQIKEFAADDVPYDLINVHHIPGNTDEEAQVASLERVAKANDTATVIIPVKREVLMSGGDAIKGIKWAKDLPERQIILVHGSDKPVEVPTNRPLRVLIPIIQTLHEGPFKVACTLNSDNLIPDVEVIAARVLELPTDSSQYSIYSQDSHSIGDEHLTFIKTHLSRAMQSLIHPMVLPVHLAGNDIADFAKAREVDIILMEGAWSPDGEGILTQVESEIVAKVSCTIVVTMARQTVKRKSRPPKKNEQY